MFELKYDGFRALLETDCAGARLLSRNRKRFRRLDELAVALAKRLRVKDATIDGEVVCVDDSGRPIKHGTLLRHARCANCANDVAELFWARAGM